MPAKGEVVLSVKDMCKNFGVTVALNHVDLEVRAGEIRGLIGENGSGKSIISSIVAGMQPATSGDMTFKGNPWKAVPGVSEEKIKADLAVSHQGGLRWQGGDKEAVWLQNTTYQKYSKIPLLIAANCDDGGSGCLPEGTFVATAAQCGAGQGTDNAYHVGLVAGREASAIGCNWMFNPVADIYMNWRNTIVNTRSFGEDVDTIIANVRAYIKGIKDANPNMACCCKHFPGDGVEELDQHLALGVNDLSVEDWNKTFRRVYQTMIDEGLESVMVGHIALPEMSRRLRPGIADADIKPATMAPELLTDLLRGEMGFNGVVITDASHMVGFTATAKRSDALPEAIAAGCDMILFANDVEEDIGYIKAGYESGLITEERLSDALHRVLGLKAHLHLYEESVRIPDKAGLDIVGCEEHKSYTEQAADTCVTLVKDTRNILPVDPAQKKRAFPALFPLPEMMFLQLPQKIIPAEFPVGLEVVVSQLRLLGEPIALVLLRTVVPAVRQIGWPELVRAYRNGGEELVVEFGEPLRFLLAHVGDVQGVAVTAEGVPVVLPGHAVVRQPAVSLEHTLGKNDVYILHPVLHAPNVGDGTGAAADQEAVKVHLMEHPLDIGQADLK